MDEADRLWQEHLRDRLEYTETLIRLAEATNLVALHTLECAKAAEQASIQANLTAFYVGEYLKESKTGRRIRG